MNRNVLNEASEIVAAYVSRNHVTSAELPKLVASVHRALLGLGTTVVEPEAEIVPAVAIKKSVTREAITCLVCGKQFRTLKRHIFSDHQLDIAGYRTMFGLPTTYPMVAEAYSATRSNLAREIGLGSLRKRSMAEAPVEEATQAEAEAEVEATETRSKLVTPHTKASQTRKRRTKAEPVEEASSEPQDAQEAQEAA